MAEAENIKLGVKQSQRDRRRQTENLQVGMVWRCDGDGGRDSDNDGNGYGGGTGGGRQKTCRWGNCFFSSMWVSSCACEDVHVMMKMCLNL